MQPWRFIQKENEVHHIGQRSIALDIPSDLVGAAHHSRAKRRPGEGGLPQSRGENLLGEHLARPRARLVDGVGKGVRGDRLETILGGKVVATVGLNLRQLLLGPSNPSVQIADGLEDHHLECVDGGKEQHHTPNGACQYFLALVHPAVLR